MSELLRYEDRDGVALVTMDDGKVNALSPTMLEAFGAALDRAEREAKALVIVGRPGRFSAGFDLKTMMSGVGPAKALIRLGAETLMRLYLSPLPTVAACTGHALAGGALLLLACDTRVGTAGEFQVGLNEVAISMPLPLFAQGLARDRLAKRHLIAATLQAKRYAPSEALEVGYLDALEAAGSVVDRAEAEARALAQLSRQAYGLTKKGLREATATHVRSTLAADLERIVPS